MDTIKKIAAWLLFMQPVGPVRLPRFLLCAVGIILLGLLVSLLTGCSSDFTFATVRQVEQVEEKFDDAFEEMQDTVVLEKAKGAEDGAAAVAAISAGQEFTASTDATPADEGGIDWLALIGAILGINLTGMAGLNAYRNKTRQKVLSEYE